MDSDDKKNVDETASPAVVDDRRIALRRFALELASGFATVGDAEDRACAHVRAARVYETYLMTGDLNTEDEDAA